VKIDMWQKENEIFAISKKQMEVWLRKKYSETKGEAG
jgi:hypothetical protein